MYIIGIETGDTVHIEVKMLCLIDGPLVVEPLRYDNESVDAVDIDSPVLTRIRPSYPSNPDNAKIDFSNHSSKCR